MLIVEKFAQRSLSEIIIHILCLLLPIAAAFTGYFLSDFIWNIFSQKKTTELFKFLCSIVFFLIPTIIIFIKTRNANPIMKMQFSDSGETSTSPDAPSTKH